MLLLQAISPQAVATLLISVLGTDNLSDAADSTRVLSRICAQDGECGLTGGANLLEAVIAMLSQPALADRVIELSVSRTSASAELTYKWTGKSKFVGAVKALAGIQNWMTLSGALLRKIAAAMNVMAGTEDQSSADKKATQVVRPKSKSRRK